MSHASDGHTHAGPGASAALSSDARAVLKEGLLELVAMTEGLEFKPIVSERYPLPVSAAVYGTTPEPEAVRREVEKYLDADPIAALEAALVLLELYESNQPGQEEHVPNDASFLNACFGSKRINGWIAPLGDADVKELEDAVNARWQFRFFPGRTRRTAAYPLVNRLARYGFVYGRIEPGDSHAMGHFIEEYTPGVMVCRGRMDSLELTLSLAAMKFGVPAVLPSDYPFPLGRRIAADSLEEIVEAVVAFPNIRRLLDVPGIPRFPDYMDPAAMGEKFEPVETWGDTKESFYLLRKGQVVESDVEVVGEVSADGALGVVLTADAEPMDAFDRRYIEERAVRGISMLRGVRPALEDGRLKIEIAAGADVSPRRIGEALVAAIRHDFPKIEKLHARIVLDAARLRAMKDLVREEFDAREAEVAATSEETVKEFVTCVGCSPFAPDHVCILTPDRPPQCDRNYAHIKTGALYGFDDMSNIHHRTLHAGINSFGLCAKGECLDPVAGEWSGLNEAAARLTGGRTTRIQLHCLDTAPTTGCGCFQIIMFKTEQPRPGIGIMRRGYKGSAPDGRSWQDLHYALAGKQTPGIAGAGPGYLKSPRFLAAHDGWKSVVWVSPEIAEMMGDALPEHVQVGPNAG